MFDSLSMTEENSDIPGVPKKAPAKIKLASLDFSAPNCRHKLKTFRPGSFTRFPGYLIKILMIGHEH